jgi:hypothetical protein
VVPWGSGRQHTTPISRKLHEVETWEVGGDGGVRSIAKSIAAGERMPSYRIPQALNLGAGAEA